MNHNSADMKSTYSSLRTKRSGKAMVTTAALHFIITLGAVFMIFPFIWTLSNSFKSMGEMFSYPPVLLPEKFLFSNFTNSWSVMPFGQAYLNSIYITLVILVIQLITCTMAAYALARIEFKGREFIFITILAMLMVPHQVTMIPTYLIVSKLGWLNTHWALIIPNSIFWAFGVFMMRQFMLSIPKELEEAAMVDGASTPRIYAQIMLPLVKPALAALMIFSFLSNWNAFLYPLLYLSDRELFTVPLLLNAFKGQYTTNWSYVMAGTMISIIPVLIVYMIAQKHIIEGIAMTGIKG